MNFCRGTWLYLPDQCQYGVRLTLTIRLTIIKKVNYDTAAAKLAIDWVGDSNLKAELFADSFDRVFTESEIVSKTRKAIQEATEALALFDTVTE